MRRGPFCLLTSDSPSNASFPTSRMPCNRLVLIHWTRAISRQTCFHSRQELGLAPSKKLHFVLLLLFAPRALRLSYKDSIALIVDMRYSLCIIGASAISSLSAVPVSQGSFLSLR